MVDLSAFYFGAILECEKVQIWEARLEYKGLLKPRSYVIYSRQIYYFIEIIKTYFITWRVAIKYSTESPLFLHTAFSTYSRGLSHLVNPHCNLPNLCWKLLLSFIYILSTSQRSRSNREALGKWTLDSVWMRIGYYEIHILSYSLFLKRRGDVWFTLSI